MERERLKENIIIEFLKRLDIQLEYDRVGDTYLLVVRDTECQCANFPQNKAIWLT